MLIKQAWIAPAAMTVPMVAAVFVPNYNSMSQQISELHGGPAWVAILERGISVVAGLSLLLFALGVGRRGALWTALTTVMFGAAIIASSIFPMGHALHGLYGLALFSVLVPAFYLAENRGEVPGWFRNLSLFSAFGGLVYMWALLIGLDPEGWQGLTQRAATLLVFGWYALAAWQARTTEV